MSAPERAARLRRLGKDLRNATSEEVWQILAQLLEVVGPIVRTRLRQRYKLASDECDDILSNALVRVFESRSRLRPDGSLAGYLIRVADHLAVDHLRRQVGLDPAMLDTAIQPASEPTDASLGAHHLRDALDVLDSTSRKILEAYSRSDDSENWTESIARELGLTPNAVRVRKHRAIEQIKRLLRAPGTPPDTNRKDDLGS